MTVAIKKRLHSFNDSSEIPKHGHKKQMYAPSNSPQQDTLTYTKGLRQRKEKGRAPHPNLNPGTQEP